MDKVKMALIGLMAIIIFQVIRFFLITSIICQIIGIMFSIDLMMKVMFLYLLLFFLDLNKVFGSFYKKQGE